MEKAVPRWRVSGLGKGAVCLLSPLSKTATISEAAALGKAEPRASTARWVDAFTPGRLLLLIAVFLFALYPEVIIGTHSFFDRDFGLFTYPVAHYARGQLWQGHLPLWNALSDCGVPFLAQWNTGLCYPLSFFYLIFPLPWSLNYFCLGHLLLAGLGMYLLARYWTGNSFAASVAGLIYALNGLSFNCLMWTSNLAGLAWLPFTILYVSRGWREGGRVLIAGSLAGAMQMLAGAPEFVLLTWLMLATLWLLEFGPSFVNSRNWFCFSHRTAAQKSELEAMPAVLSSSLRFITIVVLVAGLSAVQLLPFFQLAARSDRALDDGNAAWSMPPSGWANFLVPLFHCTRTLFGTYIQPTQQWTTSYYLGVGTLALAGVAALKCRSKRARWLAAIALIGMIMALGNHAFIYPLVKRIIPAFGLARYPIKFLIPATFALPLLAAFGTRWAATQGGREWRRPFAVTGALLLAASIVTLLFARFSPIPDENWHDTIINGLGRIVFFLLSAGAVVLMVKVSNPAHKRSLGFACLIFLGLDAITHTGRQNPTVPNAAYGDLAREMRPLPAIGGSRAMVSPRNQAILSRATFSQPLAHYVAIRRSLFENCNLSENLPKVNGFFSLHLQNQAAINAILYQPTNYPSGLIDFLGASQLSSEDDFRNWVPRSSALPLITGGQKVIFADAGTTLRALASPGFNSKEVVYLPQATAGKINATNAARSSIQQTEFSAQRISAIAINDAPALVVIAQNDYPSWRAFVDGRPAPLLRANYSFQAVEMPAGKHTLQIEYRDTRFKLGAAISGLSVLICAALAIGKGNRNARFFPTPV